MDSRNRDRGRQGQMLVIACLVIPLMCLIAALAVDVGLLCTSRSRLQNAADAASLAAVLELWDRRSQGEDETAARCAGETEAGSIVGANYSEAGMQVEFGLWNGSAFSPISSSLAANAVRVRTSRTEGAPGGPDRTFFAGFIGLDEVDQQREAVARFRPNCLIPFAVWEPDIVPVGDYLTLYDDTSVAPGVFGLLDFDGGANSTDDLVEWLANGYPGLIWIPPDPGYLVVEGNTGFVAAINSPVDDHINVGDVVVACVYTNVWGTGDNTYFEVVGFVKLVITDRGNTKVDGVPKKYIRALLTGKYIPGSGATWGELRDFMALQLVS